jgi:hypothetical protein
MIHRTATLTIAVLLTLLASGCSQQNVADGMVVEASCGQCQLGLPGEGCDLAVRVDGQAYYVDGTGIDDHGDAHASDGFCNSVRQARVTGRVENGRYAVKSFELLPDS